MLLLEFAILFPDGQSPLRNFLKIHILYMIPEILGKFVKNPGTSSKTGFQDDITWEISASVYGLLAITPPLMSFKSS